MDMLTLEVLAAHEPGKPITRTGKRLIHARCLADIINDMHSPPALVITGFEECTYGIATGMQCTKCHGFFEQP